MEQTSTSVGILMIPPLDSAFRLGQHVSDEEEQLGQTLSRIGGGNFQ